MNRSAHAVTAIVLAASAVPAAVSAQTLTEIWRTGGFATPESATFLPGTGQIAVSNIGGFGPDAGADGKLSLIDADGAVVNADWITGLTDPKGMVEADGRLYVADAVGVQVIDIAAGTLVETVAVPDSALLNDVTTDGAGNIYVTDMFAGGIVKIAGGEVSWLVAPGGISAPNGILWDDGRLVVGSFGSDMGENMTVGTLGGLLTVDPATGAVAPVEATTETASVDGIARVGDWIVYNDNPTGRIFGLGADGALAELGTTAPGAADHGSDGTTLFVPFLMGGEVAAYRIE